MKALTIRQPWASLIAHGVKTIETRSWRTHYRGRLAIHAGAAPARLSEAPEAWARFSLDDYIATRHPARNISATPLPLGAICATATLVDCLPIWGSPFCQPPEGGDWVGTWHDDELTHYRLHEQRPTGCTWEPHRQMADQLPYGDFTPGRWAWLLDDVQPTTERCPWCWREGAFPLDENRGCWCEVCDGDTAIDPIPAKGRQGLWEWTP